MSDGIYERLMKIAWFLVLIALLAACTSAAPTATPTATPKPTNTPQPTSTPTTTDTPQHTITAAATCTPSPTLTNTPSPTRTASFTPSPTFALGTCPLDLSHDGVYYLAGVSSEHVGVDIIGPHGEPIVSPGNCTVIGLFIDWKNNHGIHLECNDYPLSQVDRIGIAHIDLAWNDYQTLKQYGISIDTFFKYDGSPKIGVENVRPRQNTQFTRGEGPIAFNGNSGDHPMPYHIHIDFWEIENDQFINLDPDKYLACK